MMFLRFFIKICLSLTLLAAGMAQAYDYDVDDNKKALALYKQAQKEYNKGRKVKAQELLKEALDLVERDGRIVVGFEEVTTYVKGNRGIRIPQTQRTERFDDYYANQLLSKVKKDMDYDHLVKQNEENRLNKMMNPPSLALLTNVKHKFGKSEFMDGESGSIHIVVINSGASAAENVKIHLDMADDLKLKHDELPSFNRIAPGEKKEIDINFSVLKGTKSAHHNIVARAEDVDGFDAIEKIAMTTKAFTPPELIIDNIELLEEARRKFTFRFAVRNVSSVDAANVIANIDSLGAQGLIVNKTSVNFDLIPANSVETAELTIFVTPKYLRNNQDLNLKVNIVESTGLASLTQNIAKSFSTAASNTMIAATSQSITTAPLYPSLYSNIPKGQFVGQERNSAYAVLIGNQRYSQMPHVDYAENDVAAMKRYLVDVLNFRERNIEIITNADYKKLDELLGTPKDNFKGSLRKKIDSVKQYGAKPTVFVYYSGHGAPSLDGKNAYLVPTDIKSDQIDTYGYNLSNFYQSLNSIGAEDVTIVMDTCFSGNASGNSQKLLFEGISPGRLVKSSWNSASLDSGLVFTSTGQEEVSHWLPEAKQSMFTYFYLSGLAGKADEDGNKEITVGELIKYVGINVAQETGGKQRPNVTGDNNKVIARLN